MNENFPSEKVLNQQTKNLMAACAVSQAVILYLSKHLGADDDFALNSLREDLMAMAVGLHPPNNLWNTL